MAMPTSAVRQRRRVVHAVADHRDRAAAFLEARDGRGLVGRQDLGGDLVDPEPARDRVGHRLAVAGDHRDPDAEARAAPSTASCRLGADLVLDARATPATVPSTTTWRTVRPSRSQSCRDQRCGARPSSASRRGPPTAPIVPVDDGTGAATGQRLEVGGWSESSRPRSPAPSTIARASGCSESASTAAASRRTSSASAEPRDVDERRLARGQRARSCRR